MSHEDYENYKPPKQWKRWLEKAGITLQSRESWNRGYGIGYGRRFMVSRFGTLDVSCPIEDFDRWANSRVASVDMTSIKYESEFIKLVEDLLEEAKINENNG